MFVLVAGDEERRLHVPHEGSRSQHPQRRRRCRCPRRIRQVQGTLHQVEIDPRLNRHRSLLDLLLSFPELLRNNLTFRNLI